MRLIADRSIDCLGLYCPIPVLRARDAFRDMPAGATLEVLADDPAAEADMRQWAAHAGHELLAIERDGTTVRLVVRKAR